jgi:hypothetical protein
MRYVQGVYDGAAVVLQEDIGLPANTTVRVLIPEQRDQSLPRLLDELDHRPIGRTLSTEEVVALVHEVRESRP